MESKFLLRSKTIWGGVLLFVVNLFEAHGYHVADLVGPMTQSVGNLVNDILNFAGLVLVLMGRIEAKSPIHLSNPGPQLTAATPLTGVLLSTEARVAPASGATASIPLEPEKVIAGFSKGPLLVFAAVACIGLMAGCADSGTADQQIEASLPLIRTGSSVAAGAYLDFGVQQATTRARLAGQMDAASGVIAPLASGQLPTPEQLSTAILTAGGSASDAQYAKFSTALTGLYASYYPRLVQGDAKTAADVLAAIAVGVEDATASYVTTPAVSTNAAPAAN